MCVVTMRANERSNETAKRNPPQTESVRESKTDNLFGVVARNTNDAQTDGRSNVEISQQHLF